MSFYKRLPNAKHKKRGENSFMQDDAVREAEKIVSRYMKEMGYSNKRKKLSKKMESRFILFGTISLCVIVLALALARVLT